MSDVTQPSRVLKKPHWVLVMLATALVSVSLGGLGSYFGFREALSRELGAYSARLDAHDERLAENTRRLEETTKRLTVVENRPSASNLDAFVRREEVHRELDRMRGEVGGLQQRMERMEDRLDRRLGRIESSIDDVLKRLPGGRP